MTTFLFLLIAAPSFAQTPDLSKAAAQASKLLQDSPVSDPGSMGRQTPDIDSDVEPAEALGNFHEVAPGFYRSAQPNRDGYAQLMQMGLKTILNLTGNADREREQVGPEITVEAVPMSGFSAPSFEQVDQALDVIATAKRPLLVHCQFGKDRTGFVVASYRVVVEKMDADAAAKEAHGYGCCFAPMGDLADFLRRYREHRRSLAVR